MIVLTQTRMAVAPFMELMVVGVTEIPMAVAHIMAEMVMIQKAIIQILILMKMIRLQVALAL